MHCHRGSASRQPCFFNSGGRSLRCIASPGGARGQVPWHQIGNSHNLRISLTTRHWHVGRFCALDSNCHSFIAQQSSQSVFLFLATLPTTHASDDHKQRVRLKRGTNMADHVFHATMGSDVDRWAKGHCVFEAT